MMNLNLDQDHALFGALKENQPVWWTNLMSDKEIWADIRKSNNINVYYRTGSIMKLWYAKDDFRAQMHFEYIPIQEEKTHIPFDFTGDTLDLVKSKFQIPSINNFELDVLKRIKKRIKKHNPPGSEKSIQASYVLKNNGFIDTEFQHRSSRIDLIWIDNNSKKIFFVELKTIGDDRLYFGKNYNTDKDNIAVQLKKYQNFVSENSAELLEYYKKLFLIKKNLNILPKGCDVETLDGYTIEEYPILLVGDCTQKWIDINGADLNEKIKKFSYGAFYHGVSTKYFYIPEKTKHNKFIFK